MSGQRQLTRQNSLLAVQQNKDEAATAGPILLLPAAIAAVVIAHKYDSSTSVSPCQTPLGNDPYVIELALFCYIGGYMQIGQVALACFTACIAGFMNAANKKTMLKCANAPNSLLGLFYLAWAGIGLYMYSNQMSDECKNEEIAKILFAWSLIPYCLIGLVCCCLPCVICAVGATAFGITASTDAMNETTSYQDTNENEKLV